MTARGYRTLRRIARVGTALCLGKRKAALEGLLSAAYGNVVEARGHLMAIDPRDRLIGPRLRRRGVWSEAETALYARCIRAGDTIVDVGANIGYFTLLFARSAGPAGRVFAFEPEPDNFRLLETNVERNGYRNVTAVRQAVSGAPGSAPLGLATENLGDHRLGRGSAGRPTVTVPVTTLDDYFADRSEAVDFVKLDIQGLEPTAFAGAHRVFATRDEMAMLTEFWPEAMTAAGENAAAYLDEILSAGFRVARLAESGRLFPVASVADQKELSARGAESNLFCYKGPRWSQFSRASEPSRPTW